MIIDGVIGIPMDSSGRFAGCELMPAALREAGMAGWPVQDRGNVQAVLADPRRDSDTGIIGFADLVNASVVVRDALEPVLRTGERPLVTGGCCSILLGTFAAVRRIRPDAGLVFIDGHFDMHEPHRSETGEVADMEVGILLGAGPAELSGLSGAERSVEDERLVVIGPRDHDEMRDSGSPLPAEAHPAVLVIDEPELRGGGADEAASRALARLRASESDGFWVHIDFDVLSTAAFPAIDYPLAGGLDWEQLTKIVRPLALDPGFLGISVSILNPRLDPDGATAARTERWLRAVLD
ncbi:arginase family protein [Leucobacter iarius]|uniref:Arginase family protein n=1 Tax=Leucobacter iarius TaxID=333963 RepID=A0ABN2LCK5_9MICO